MARYEEDELIGRAIQAYATRARRDGFTYQQPANTSRLQTYDGQPYVLLENINGPLTVYRVKDDGHIEHVHPDYWPVGLLAEYGLAVQAPQPGLGGTYNGACIVCLTPTDTALVFQGEAEWIIAGLVVLGIPDNQAHPTAHAFWSESDPSLRKGEVPGGIVTETIRVCRSCVQASKAPFPAPVLAIPGAVIPVIGQPSETYLQSA